MLAEALAAIQILRTAPEQFGLGLGLPGGPALGIKRYQAVALGDHLLILRQALAVVFFVEERCRCGQRHLHAVQLLAEALAAIQILRAAPKQFGLGLGRRRLCKGKGVDSDL